MVVGWVAEGEVAVPAVGWVVGMGLVAAVMGKAAGRAAPTAETTAAAGGGWGWLVAAVLAAA